MSFTIKTVKADPTKFQRRILLYSDAGAGKTFFCATAQDVESMRDVLVIDIDSGTSTLGSRGDILSAEARTPAQVEEILWALVQKKPEVATIKTVVLDGASELAKRDLADIAALAAKNAPDKRTQDANELRDYMVSKSRLLRLFRMARDIPDITLIITGWAKKTYPKVPGTQQANKQVQPTAIVPDFTDAMSDTLRGMVDDIWFLFQDPNTDVRKLVTSSIGAVSAKTRNENFAKKLGTTDAEGKWLPVVENPTFPKIVQLYKQAFQEIKS